VLIVHRLISNKKHEDVISLSRRVAISAFYFQVTCLGWLFFRARDLSQAAEMVSAILNILSWRLFPGASRILKLFVWACPMVAIDLMQLVSGRDEPWVGVPTYIKIPIYVLIIEILIQAHPEDISNFLYFQF
jgi:hypothetical protein